MGHAKMWRNFRMTGEILKKRRVTDEVREVGRG